MKIRNDDVAHDTGLKEIKAFCGLCDKYNITPIHCITLRGNCQPIDIKMSNDEIRKDGANFFDNIEVVNYLKSRKDEFAVHGLWHTHAPTQEDVLEATELLNTHGIMPTYFVPPFNEGDYPSVFCGLELLQKVDRLESFLDEGEPKTETSYIHSWRFDDKWFTFDKLDKCLARICLKK